MVAATLGLPESFFGDVSVGTLATAKSLDRPTELKMRNRQTLWSDVHRSILAFVVAWAVRAGRLKGSIEEQDDGTPAITLEQVEDPNTGELVERDATVSVTFPPLLEHDVAASVQAIVAAATLGSGGALAGTIDEQTVSRLLLQALGVEDIDAVMAVIYPPEEDLGADEPDGEPQSESAIMVEAVRELREAVATFVVKYKEA